MNTPKPVQRSEDGKPKRIGRIAGMVAVLVLLAALAGFALQRSYYPMDGEVRILAKEQGRGFTLTVEQGFHAGQKAGRFRLKCTEEQYHEVEIGDIVDCSRTQSALTGRGKVHTLH